MPNLRWGTLPDGSLGFSGSTYQIQTFPGGSGAGSVMIGDLRGFFIPGGRFDTARILTSTRTMSVDRPLTRLRF
jgi:hypothetical protein